MLIIFKCVFALSLLCCGMYSSAADDLSVSLKPGEIVNRAGVLVSEAEVLAALARHDYVLIGEKHDNAQHHKIELRLIQARMGSTVGAGKVVFEMLDESQDALIAQLQVGDSVAQMRQTLRWPEKPGSWDWATYAPLFEAALRADALRSGNVSRSLISTIYREGENALQNQARFRSVLSASAALRDYHLQVIFKAHCGMQKAESLGPMVHIQLAKDASMASAMLQHARALLIAGGEHVRRETGVPWHLQVLQPKASSLVIQLVEKKPEVQTVSALIAAFGEADYYWLTEASVEKDYCAQVKGRAAQ